MLKFSLMILLALSYLPNEVTATETGTLGNRFYIKNFLIKKFGNHLEDIVDKNIIENSRVFNGPCDIYGQVMYADSEGNINHENIDSKCFGDLSDSKISLLGSSSSLRKSWMLKTCLQISNNEKTLNTIKNKNEFVKEYFNYKSDYQNFIKDNDIDKQSKKELVFKLCTTESWQYI